VLPSFNATRDGERVGERPSRRLTVVAEERRPNDAFQDARRAAVESITALKAYMASRATPGSKSAASALLHSLWQRLVDASSESRDQVHRTTHRPRSGRRLLDLYGHSLVFTNHLVSRHFVRRQRKVPAHMPHFVDRKVMARLQDTDTFRDAFDATSSHRFRSPRDVQFAFAYFYFVMEGGALQPVDVARFFHDELDTDGDGVLNSNELRTLASVIKGTAPSETDISLLRACLLAGSTTSPDPSVRSISLSSLMACEDARKGVLSKARRPPTHGEGPIAEVAFEMITDDFNKTLSQLDSVRARKAKFVCVNDDMRDAPESLQRVLRDFYDGYFPTPSQFELPPGTLNPFLHVDSLQPHLRVRALLLWVGRGIVLLAAGALFSFIVRVVHSTSP
jgi:UDP-N-acetylglucosamine-lysosomal-enzyme